MSSSLRVVLIDPCEATRKPLLELLKGSKGVAVGGVRTSFAEAGGDDLIATPRDLTIVVLDSGPKEGCDLIRALQQRDHSRRVVPASSVRDAEIMLEAFRAGAPEFLLLPANEAELSGILAQFQRRAATEPPPSPRRKGQVIAVAGANGGVGCTSIALNLAVALRNEGLGEVALADFDMVGGLIAPWLEAEHETTLPELCRDVQRLDHLLLRRGMTRHKPTGLMLLPHLSEIAEAAHIDPENLRRLIELMRESFEAVVIDTGKGLHATDIAAFEMADVILLVVQLDLMCLHSTMRLLKLLRGMTQFHDKVHLVLNRVGSGAAGIRLMKVEEALGMRVSWNIPNAFRAFHLARSQGEPIKCDSAGKEAYTALHGMARQLRSTGEMASEPPGQRQLAHHGAAHHKPGWWSSLRKRPARIATH